MQHTFTYYLTSSSPVYNISQLADTKSGHLVHQIGRRPAGFMSRVEDFSFSAPHAIHPLPHQLALDNGRQHVQDWSEIKAFVCCQSPVLFGAGCSSSRTSTVIFEALEKLNLEAMNKAASHELPTLPDLYLLLGGYCSIMGPAAGASQEQKVSCTLLLMSLFNLAAKRCTNS